MSATLPVPRAALDPEAVCRRLQAHGFRVVRRSAGHVLLSDGVRSVVVPVHSSTVPAWVGQTLEWLLEPSLGPGWLANDQADDLPPRTTPRLELHAVFLHDDEGWNGFLAEEPAVLSFGAGVDEARTRLLEAIELWFGVEADAVELIEVQRAA